MVIKFVASYHDCVDIGYQISGMMREYAVLVFLFTLSAVSSTSLVADELPNYETEAYYNVDESFIDLSPEAQTKSSQNSGLEQQSYTQTEVDSRDLIVKPPYTQTETYQPGDTVSPPDTQTETYQSGDTVSPSDTQTESYQSGNKVKPPQPHTQTETDLSGAAVIIYTQTETYRMGETAKPPQTQTDSEAYQSGETETTPLSEQTIVIDGIAGTATAGKTTAHPIVFDNNERLRHTSFEMIARDKRPTASPIIGDILVSNIIDCARLCLENTFLCHSFTFTGDSGDKKCALFVATAGGEFETSIGTVFFRTQH